MNNLLTKWFKTPYLEAVIMIFAVILSYIALTIIAALEKGEVVGMPTMTMVLWLLAFFLISTAIALVAVICGIGGGVIFTPIMLAFTGVDSVVIRAAGLIVAMFSGLISTGIFLKQGIGNLKLCVTVTVSQGIGALFGAWGAIALAQIKGSDPYIRIALGVVLTAIGIYYMVGGKKIDWPIVKKVDRFTKMLKLEQPFFEESESRVVEYKIKNILPGLGIAIFIGALGGFFGMGAGWAITPMQNLVLGIPLKVAAANSGIILGMVDCIAVWPYILTGAIIPLFALPWLAGQVVGGYFGSYLLVKIRASLVRQILIGIMFFTSFGLFTNGFEKLKLIPKVPPEASLVVFLLMIVFVIAMAYISKRKESKGGIQA
ncbi:MAG: Sulfite exporter TauE/SafE [Firmicutes bacterium ADurb.Bin193]|nr:MAG: Sulfite exporter TauE/SafE [Firmicutes bacterium ADurb.Bin193]